MTSPRLSERGFQRLVCDLAFVLGWTRVYHTYRSDRSPKGFPDLVLVSPRRRRVVFAELKATGGRVTADQLEWLDDLKAAGAEAYLWFPADWDAIKTTLGG
jgi:hypothetical protein